MLNFSTPGTSLAASLQPFPQTRQEKDMDKHANGFFAALVVTLAFAFSPGSYIVFIVKERESNAKHLQVISGVNIYAYWLSNYVWDLTSFSLTAFICCIWVRFDDAPSLNQGEHFTIILVAVTLYGLSVISFTYLCSFLFKSASTAQNTMIMVYVVAGILMTIVSFVLNALKAGSDDRGYLQYVSFFFRLFPNFCLGDTIFFMSLVDTEDPWAWDVSGYNFLFMVLEFFGYSSLVFLLESPLVRALAACVPRRQMAPLLVDPLDVDVRAERDGIRNGDRNGDLIRLEGLRKAFGDQHIAVSDLYFSIPKGQCFGFLGVNGAVI
jgi:ATP-binding cassette subfamily A (ABC1) protein 1